MDRAPFLLAACLTGSVEHMRTLERSPQRLITLVNTNFPNFGNQLAKALPNHAVYCTPQTQVAGELEIVTDPFLQEGDEVCSLSGSRPFNFAYLSAKQTMYRYIHQKDKPRVIRSWTAGSTEVTELDVVEVGEEEGDTTEELPHDSDSCDGADECGGVLDEGGLVELLWDVAVSRSPSTVVVSGTGSTYAEA